MLIKPKSQNVPCLFTVQCNIKQNSKWSKVKKTNYYKNIIQINFDLKAIGGPSTIRKVGLITST